MNNSEIKTTDSLEEAILKAQKGDKQAFRIIVENHQRFAFAVAFKILLNEEDAKDTAQDSFVKLWKHIGDYKFEAKFTTWFYKIIINLSIDKLKANKRKEKTVVTIPGEIIMERLASNDPDDYNNKELIEIIGVLIEKLSPKQRLVFTLRDLNGLDIHTISDSINISENSVKTNLVYARRKIKGYLTTIYHWK